MSSLARTTLGRLITALLAAMAMLCTTGGTANAASSHLSTGTSASFRIGGIPQQATRNPGSVRHVSPDPVRQRSTGKPPRRHAVVNTAGQRLKVRSAPSRTARVISSLPNGARVTVVRQVRGSRVPGSLGATPLWVKLPSGGYISRAYVFTDSDRRRAAAALALASTVPPSGEGFRPKASVAASRPVPPVPSPTPRPSRTPTSSMPPRAPIQPQAARPTPSPRPGPAPKPCQGKCKSTYKGPKPRHLKPLWNGAMGALFSVGMVLDPDTSLHMLERPDLYRIDPDSKSFKAGSFVGALRGVRVAPPGARVAPVASIATPTALRNLAGKALASVGPGQGAVHGTRVHAAFANQIRALGRADLHPEVSYLNGRVVPYGTKGAVRLDVVEGDRLAPKAIFDLKTGGAKLTTARITQIRQHLPSGSKGVSISEVRP